MEYKYKKIILITLMMVFFNSCGYFNSAERNRAQEAKDTINLIFNACKDYVNSGGTGELPYSIEELEGS